MDEELLNGLKFLGLSGNDAKIYCALLRLPDASAYQLSKKTGIHRSNTYDSLNRLVEKGLSSYTFVNNVKRYTSVEPSQISSKIVDQANKIGSIINQYNQTEKPHIQVRIFEGAKGLSQVYQDIINSGHDYYALGATGKIYDLLKDEYEVFVRKRVEKKNAFIRHF